MAGRPATQILEPEVPETAASPETDVVSPRGGRPRDEGRDQAILEAAIDLLAGVGYDAMTIESIAIRAKVSKATIYRRWPGKAELVAEAIKNHHGPQMKDPEDTGSLRGDLLSIVTAMFENFAGVDGGLMCGLATAVRADAALGRALSSKKHDYRERVSGLIATRAKARGELPPEAEVDPIFDVAPGVALFHQMTGEPLDATYAEYLVDKILLPLLRS